MEKLKNYLNPILRLGEEKYSIALPIFGTLLIALLIEAMLVSGILADSISALVIISASIIMVVYFSFRDGIRGGVIATTVVAAYYIYIVFGRMDVNDQPSGAQTIILLVAIYLFLSVIIGWLKQTLDKVTVKEKVARQIAEDEKLRLQSVLQHLPVGVQIVDIYNGKVEGNKKLEQMLKRKVIDDFSSETEYLAKHSFKRGRPLASKDIEIFKALAKKKKTSSREIEYVRDDKKHLFLKVSATPVFNKKKKIMSVVSTYYDATQEKEHEKRKDNFVNMASHELKTPITSMNLYLDMLLKRSQKVNGREMLAPLVNLQEQTRRLEELVGDLLDVSRIQTGKLHFKKQSFMLNELVDEVCALFKETRPDRKITIISEPVVVNADRFRIYQVLTNLITNAIKYSNRGDEIIIEMRKSKGSVKVSVKDFGIGIAREERKRIFDLLYQVNDVKEKTFPGLGMGLYISKEIIKTHRGKIWADGEKGKGSTFYFTLPLQQQQTAHMN